MRADSDGDIRARVDEEPRRRLHLAQCLHGNFGEREQSSRIKVLLAKLNEIDAVSGPVAQLILQPLDLRGIYEARCVVIRNRTTEHHISVFG